MLVIWDFAGVRRSVAALCPVFYVVWQKHRAQLDELRERRKK